jgi:hypothetical protein
MGQLNKMADELVEKSGAEITKEQAFVRAISTAMGAELYAQYVSGQRETLERVEKSRQHRAESDLAAWASDRIDTAVEKGMDAGLDFGSAYEHACSQMPEAAEVVRKSAAPLQARPERVEKDDDFDDRPWLEVSW